MSVVKEDNKCTITWQNNSAEGNIGFMQAIDEAYQDGYRYKFTNRIADEPFFNTMVKRVVLYKECAGELSELEDCKTIKDMEGFAKRYGIEIPEDITHHQKIRKFLKEKVSA